MTEKTDDYVLPRQLRDGLTPEVLAVPAPPIPTLESPFGLRLVDPETDAETIAGWMRQPKVVAGWEQDWPGERWYRHLKCQLESSYSRPVFGCYQGRPAGYLEIYRAAQDSVATRYTADPYDVGIHMAIPDLGMAPRGFAIRLYPQFVAGLFELEPRCRRVIVDPDHRNTEARRICEYAGLAFLGEHHMTNRTMALYVLPRTPDDVPRAESIDNSDHRVRDI